MKFLFGLGLLVLVLGILSLVVPIPHREHAGVSAGNVSIGVETHHSERVSPIVSAALIIAGAGMAIGARTKVS